MKKTHVDDRNIQDGLSVITAYIESHKPLLEPHDDISTKRLEARENLINKLNDVQDLLQDMIGKVNDKIQLAKDTQNKELTLMDTLMSKFRNTLAPTPQNWVTVAKKPKNVQPVQNPTQSSSGVITVYTPPSATPEYVPVHITGEIYLPAIVVPTFSDVKQDGNLYYVENADHFAVIIAGQMFHNNIGSIYYDTKNICKIRDCKYTSGCAKMDECQYYHDPKKYGGKDHRNYIANTWIYTDKDNKDRSHRFGDRDNLNVDILNVQPDEAIRYRDRAMHELLCAILLKNK